MQQILMKNFFNPGLDFNKCALDIFRYQVNKNAVYRNYIKALKIDSNAVKKIEQIPFLPVQFFKTHKVVTGDNTGQQIFTSSATTGSLVSSHYVTDVSLYEKSFFTCFKKFYGNPEEYCLLALLPSYLEREGSSLVYMCDKLIKQSNHTLSGFYLSEFEKLLQTINQLIKQNQKFILLGVTYALLDFAEYVKDKNFEHGISKGIIMETGGMKGKRKEMLRQEVHKVLKNAFGLQHIHSEYGMTELLSQAYSTKNGVYFCPPWMQVLIRDINDPFSIAGNSRTGGINVIDLANINSCAFILTQDLGRKYADGSFEVLGRFDDSDVRGCNLMIE